MAILSNPISLPPPPPPPPPPDFNFDNQVSPTILIAIIILSIILFFSALLLLLLRFFLKAQIRTDPEDTAGGGASAFQGQLQQLFHLHDAGVDQSFIDTLPVFLYKAIIGLKLDPFDCSVCLCEFQPNDKLRLLTKCSHAFHMECIDTWLLSHSTCPLCRAGLISDVGFPSKIVGVLDSVSHSSREIGEIQTGSFLGFLGDVLDFAEMKPDEPPPPPAAAEQTVVPIKLGKFKSLESNGEGSSNNGKVDSRRCFSMGSFGYVMDENSSLQVPIRTPAVRKAARKKRNLPLMPGSLAAMSECDCESRREFNFTELNEKVESFRHGSLKESFVEEKVGGTNQPRSENGMGMAEEEYRRRNSLECVENRRSFVRRTLQWVIGKNTKNSRIVHSSFSTNDDHADCSV
ncbi:RING-H2 finger protein ATL13-like [Cucurbita maxima]|uniref:RING-type E3 ubiquitin transferase n=1 Tax=Cucurbita maxima TaxID=3661 RepID=A0A6J1HNL1_CUCMA|nr:RING-H2 finger protein ATL13-like [Cucurbita maxima]